MGLSLPWSLLLLSLLMGPRISREDPAPLVLTGTLGGSVVLPLHLLPEQQVESISWMFRSVPGAIASVTVVEAGGPDTFYQAESRYWGRMNVVGPGHSLQISNLSQEDAGSYRAHINLRSSRITHIQEYQLQVFEKLVPPRVTLSSRIGDNGNCIIILTCVAESREGTVAYSWTPLGPRTVISHGGSVLSVSLRPEDRVLTFTCTIKNPVSNSSSHPVSVPHICAGSGTLGEATVGNIVIGTLGESATLPLEVPEEQEVESVTWSSKGLIAVLQSGPAGKPVLVSEIQGPYSGRLNTSHYGYSLQISRLGLWDSGLYRAGIHLRSPHDQHHQGFHPACLREAEEAQYHCQLPDHEEQDLLCHLGLLRGRCWRGCSVQLGSPWPGGSCVPWWNHSQCLLEIWGQWQLPLHCQESCQPEL